MVVKKSGGKVYGASFTAAEKKAMNMEIERQLAVFTMKHAVEVEAMVLRQLRAKYGFGEKRLKDFFDSLDDDLQALVRRYEMGEDDMAWLCTRQLLAEGFDVKRWHKEKYPDNRG